MRIHRSKTLTPADVTLRQGLPVTSPARTLLDVATTLPDRDVERLLYEAVFAQRLVTLAEIDELLKRAGNHPGRARLERVASSRPSGSDSPPEERLLELIRVGGLPEPHTQVRMLDYVLDFLWPELGLSVEVDAYGTHGSPARFEADRRRDARLLTQKGISVLRLTKSGIEQRPLEALALVARAIGQREASLRR